jgi:hypothetical protein
LAQWTPLTGVTAASQRDTRRVVDLRDPISTEVV